MSAIREETLRYQEFENVDEINPEDQELIDIARNASLSAYAPYSGFRVGAAIRLRSGRTIHGSNVENAAFPSGICAERTALSFAVSNYSDDFPVAIAIAAMTSEGITSDSISPCGNCRQVIAEEELRTGGKIRVILSGKDKIRIIESISQLLPLQFSRKDLMSDHP